jgi:hypothetical protein
MTLFQKPISLYLRVRERKGFQTLKIIYKNLFKIKFFYCREFLFAEFSYISI